MVAFPRAVIVFCNLIHCFSTFSLTLPSSLLKLPNTLSRNVGSASLKAFRDNKIFSYSLDLYTIKTLRRLALSIVKPLNCIERRRFEFYHRENN